MTGCLRPGPIALVIVASLLAGCATGPSSVACVPVAAYPATFLDRAADEVEHLPDGSAVEQMLADYQVMRAQARACAASR
ncbi:hypothetical protein A3840_17285 [Devosia elaeis]|uniref:Lipoprotein n=1 Tax=Devosia elaeis TaxID=1770058 RepID=A0A178HLX4_9HYPH|nr:hypothetical protein A3840_17285 [Devosia elaeis]